MRGPFAPRQPDPRAMTRIIAPEVRMADALEHIAYRLDDLVELLASPEVEFRPIPRGEAGP